MPEALKRFWEAPSASALRWLTLIALAPRLVAVLFSPGYFAHDDHFLVIEAAASWTAGYDYNNWLPWNQGDAPTPTGHSYFYVGIHFILFTTLKAIGITDPRVLMLAVRLLHALWSLIVVRTGYRIALRLSGPRVAWQAGLFLALFCFMPFLSVRNLVEVACIPLLMLGSLRLLDADEDRAWRTALIAGLWIGMAMNVRFQTIFFAAGPGLAFLITRRWNQAFAYGIGVVIPMALIQGGIDYFLWGRPWVEVTQYVLYNLANTTTYGVLPWYNYLLLLAGLLLPPLSLAVLFGFARQPRPLLLWLPVLLFIAIHSYFPNKQERFMLPIVPLFFVLGYIGWEQWRLRSQWWQQRAALWTGALAFVWALNLILLPVLCTTYGKRSRVESLSMLRDLGPVLGLIIEDSVEGEAPMPPLFYLGQWNMTVLPWTQPTADLDSALVAKNDRPRPNTILFFGEEGLEARKQRIEAVMGSVELIGRAEPGFMDRLVHWLNPVNRNETIV
ncbi:MAG TPA: glycosyltransferase family 39 protein, partial [Flavobacteriales bacterium]|nr:glycosyltransferase family 39 protein [Flavobacteriales bacterium]